MTSAGLVRIRGRLSITARARSSNACSASEPGAATRHRVSFVRSPTHRREQRDSGHQVDTDLVCQGRRLHPEPNSSYRLPSSAGEPRHVLHDSDHLLIDFGGHERGPSGHPLGRRLWCRDQQDLGARKELGHRDRDVTGPWWHVHDQEVEVVPEDVLEELLDRLVQHRASPDHCLVVAHEIVHRHHLHPIGDRRDDRLRPP